MGHNVGAHDPAPDRSGEPLSRNTKLALLSALVVAAFFVLREHWSHALGLAPYLFLLLCPLMHLFGHGHHHRRHEGEHGDRGSRAT